MEVWRSLALKVLSGLAAIFVRCLCLVFLLTGIDHCNVLCVYGVYFFLSLFLRFWLFGFSGQFATHRLLLRFGDLFFGVSFFFKVNLVRFGGLKSRPPRLVEDVRKDARDEFRRCRELTVFRSKKSVEISDEVKE